ncbi:MAG: EAL domain-containing protein, partial [Desulfuromonadales bacterium]|nr:EAL domain-containing protein [Desulfuromonadales bacterium]
DLNGSENSPDRFEVLISMKDESGKTLPPGGFLPAAERYGLITAIDRWVVQTTFDWLERNVVKQPDIDFISINLSGKSFSDDAFLEFIQKELEKRSFSADKICFEITETAAMQQMNKALNFVQEIKKIGCRFALDDFGSGMASFGYLKRFPVDYIKIDGSFVQDIVNDPLSQAVVKSIYNVAQVMQVSTIAEHAEDQETLNVLKAIGIDYVQGYVIARPGILPIQ